MGIEKSFSFWGECAKRARKGTGSFANDWQWVFGVPLASAAGVYLASFTGAAGMTTGYPILDAFLAAFIAFLITWVVAFVIRAYRAAPALFYEQKERADRLEERLRPKLEIIGMDDTAQNADGSHQIYKLKKRNSGGEQLRDCLVKLDAIRSINGHEHHELYGHIPTPFALRTEWQEKEDRSGSFNMRLGESKSVRICDRITKQAFNVIDETGVVYSWPYVNDVELHIGLYGAGEPKRTRICVSKGKAELMAD